MIALPFAIWVKKVTMNDIFIYTCIAHSVVSSTQAICIQEMPTLVGMLNPSNINPGIPGYVNLLAPMHAT